MERYKHKGYKCISSLEEVNQALVELGATYCFPAGNGIDDDDPLKEFHVSTQLGGHYRLESLIGFKSMGATEKGSIGPLCNLSGISTVYNNTMDRMTADLSTYSKTEKNSICHCGPCIHVYLHQKRVKERK